MNCCESCGQDKPILKMLYWPIKGPYYCMECIQAEQESWTDKQWDEYNSYLEAFKKALWEAY
jgi:hypothetical protein